MVIYSTAELAVLCGKSERSVQLWLKAGKLPARRVKANLYEISEVDLEPFIPRTLEISLLDRMDALERRISELEAILTARDARQENVQPIQVRHRERHPTRRESTKHETQVEIPAGSVQFFEFAKQHDVNRRTFLDQIRRGQVPIREVMKANRPGEVERWLEPAHQAAAIRFWIANGTTFTRCAQCPHQS